jgi:hypothetical protein
VNSSSAQSLKNGVNISWHSCEHVAGKAKQLPSQQVVSMSGRTEDASFPHRAFSAGKVGTAGVGVGAGGGRCFLGVRAGDGGSGRLVGGAAAGLICPLEQTSSWAMKGAIIASIIGFSCARQLAMKGLSTW